MFRLVSFFSLCLCMNFAALREISRKGTKFYAKALSQSLTYGLEYSLNVNIHADPLRTGSPVAINTTIDIISLHTNIFSTRAPVAPPLSWSKQPNDRRACRDREVRRPRIAANINTCASRQ